MKQFNYFAAAFVFAGTIIASAGPVGVVPGRILVREKAGTPIQTVSQIFNAQAAGEEGIIPGINVRILKVPEAARERVMKALQNNPNIEFAEPDSILSHDATVNDPYFSSQWHLSKIQAPSAWDYTVGTSSITIAILDTGVDPTHPDLANKLVSGWNFYNNNSNTADVQGHGTAVAGTAAAQALNGTGVASVAYGCRIMPIRVADANGLAYESTIANALNWAADRGARVANISFRASNSSTVRAAAQNFHNKGGVVVISSGNESIVDPNADNPYVLTVSATDSNDYIAPWSNTGNNVDLSAPGVNVLTTSMGGGYGNWSGTSFSAPVVAGVAGLVLSANPSLTGAQALDLIRKNSDDKGSIGWDAQYGYGRVNALKAVLAAKGTVSVADTIAPAISITSPANGFRVGNSTDVLVKATDNKAVTKVDLYVDGNPTGTSTTSPFTIRWNSKKARPGSHTLQTRAYDAAGNSSLSQVVTVYR